MVSAVEFVGEGLKHSKVVDLYCDLCTVCAAFLHLTTGTGVCVTSFLSDVF